MIEPWSSYDNWRNKLMFWLSPRGEELALCLISQGYEDILRIQLLLVYGSTFAVAERIRKCFKEYIKNAKKERKQ